VEYSPVPVAQIDSFYQLPVPVYKLCVIPRSEAYCDTLYYYYYHGRLSGAEMALLTDAYTGEQVTGNPVYYSSNPLLDLAKRNFLVYFYRESCDSLMYIVTGASHKLNRLDSLLTISFGVHPAVRVKLESIEAEERRELPPPPPGPSRPNKRKEQQPSL